MKTKSHSTIPQKIIAQLPDVEYFEVELKDGVVMLRPLKAYRTDLEKIRRKIQKLGLKENTVKEAIEWARSRS